MAVTVRLFAALREAAGTSEVAVDAAPVGTIVADLSDRFGEPFASRVTVASGMVDGRRVALDDDVDVADGSELALLPPFSGGATVASGRRRAHLVVTAASLALPVALGLAAFAPRGVFGVVVAALAAGAVVALSRALRDVGLPNMPAAAGAIALGPVLALLVAPDAAATAISGTLAAAVMVTFLLAFVSPQRHVAAAMVGGTLLVGLLVGGGAVSLSVLREALGASVFAAVMVVVGVSDAVAVAVARPDTPPRPALVTAVTAVAALGAAAVVGAVWSTSLALLAAAAVAAVVAGLVGVALHRTLLQTAPDAQPWAPVVAVTDGVLIGAPIVALWAAAASAWQ